MKRWTGKKVSLLRLKDRWTRGSTVLAADAGNGRFFTVALRDILLDGFRLVLEVARHQFVPDTMA